MHNIFLYLIVIVPNFWLKETLPNLNQVEECSFSSFMPGKSYETGQS